MCEGVPFNLLADLELTDSHSALLQWTWLYDLYFGQCPSFDFTKFRWRKMVKIIVLLI